MNLETLYGVGVIIIFFLLILSIFFNLDTTGFISVILIGIIAVLFVYAILLALNPDGTPPMLAL